MPKARGERSRGRTITKEKAERAALAGVPSVEGTSPLPRIREKQGMSQRVLAEKCGISRGRLRRLEGKEFDHITYAELRRISETLGVETGEIFFGSGATYDFYLGRKGQSALQWDVPSVGYRVISFVPVQKNLFVGKLFVSAKKRLSSAHTPRAGTIFLQMLLGKFRIQMAGESYEIEEGDHLLFRGSVPYTIENPLLRDSEALLLTLPAFKS